jgi:hypothetical protein
MHGEEDGEGDEAADVDERRRTDAQDAYAPEDKDNGDRAETWEERGSDLSEGMGTRCDAGGRSEEEGVMAGLGSFRRGFINARVAAFILHQLVHRRF